MYPNYLSDKDNKQGRKQYTSALVYLEKDQLNVSINRCRMVETWTLLAWPWGRRGSPVMPWIRPAPTAQAIGYWA